MSYLIEFKFGYDWQSYSVVLNDFTITEMLHNNLKPTDSSCSFSLVPDLNLYNLLRGIDTQNVPVRIKKNNLTVFFGYIRKTFEFKKTQRLQPVKIEIVGPSFILKKRITTNHLYIDVPLNSIVVDLLQACGITDYNLPNFNVIIPVFKTTEEATYHDVLAKLLLEYGYLFYFDKDGYFRVIKIYPENLTTTKQFNGLNCLDQISQTKKEEQKERVVVKWYELKNLQNVLVFSDTTNAKDGFKCYIELSPQQFLGDKEEWYADFHHDEGEILYSSGISLDIIKGPSIQVLKFQQAGNRALLSVKNTNSLYAETILKLDIKAQTVKVKKSINTSIVTKSSNPNATEEIQADYVFTKTYADALANYLAWYYKYCDFTYKLKSKTDYAIGDLVVVSDYGIGSITARIVKKVIQIQNGIIEYELEAVSEYIPESVSGESFINNPIPNTTIDNLYQQIDQLTTFLSGQDRDQIIPLNPIVVDAKAFIDGIYVHVTPAAGGTILEQASQYIVQRSTDQGTTWFDLNGVLNGSTKVSNTQFQWPFNRLTDGFPEASGDPEPWVPISYYRLRIKAVNSIGIENPNWVYINSIDTSSYGTWLPLQPTGGGGISAMREVRVMVDVPENVFGICGYEIQISKDQQNWYKPAVGLDVYASEDNWKQGNIGEYRRISMPQWSQSVPLEEQDTSPKNTTYFFRIRIVTDRPYVSGTPSGYVNSNGKTAGQWTAAIPVMATATSAYDVIKARKSDGTMQEGALGVDKIYAENLAAINGNLSALSGGQEDPYNYWALSDYPNRPSDRPVGTFRAGTQDVYIKSKPAATGTDEDPYIELVSKNGHSIKLTNEGMKFSNAVGSIIGANDGTIESLRTKEIQLTEGGKIYGGGYTGAGSNPTGSAGFYLDSAGNVKFTGGRLSGAKVPVSYNGSWIFGSIPTLNNTYTYNTPTYDVPSPVRVVSRSDGSCVLVYADCDSSLYSGTIFYRIRYSNGNYSSPVTIISGAGFSYVETTVLNNDDVWGFANCNSGGYIKPFVIRANNSVQVYSAYKTQRYYWITSKALSNGLIFVCSYRNGYGLESYLFNPSNQSWVEINSPLSAITGYISVSNMTTMSSAILADGRLIVFVADYQTYPTALRYTVYDQQSWTSLSNYTLWSDTIKLGGDPVMLPDNRLIIPFIKRPSSGNAIGSYLFMTSVGSFSSVTDQFSPGVTHDRLATYGFAFLPNTGKVFAIGTVKSSSSPYTTDVYTAVSTSSYSTLPIGIIDTEIGAGIVEIGENSNGSWIKFADGTMIAGKKDITLTFNNQAVKGIYITLPIEFVSIQYYAVAHGYGIPNVQYLDSGWFRVYSTLLASYGMKFSVNVTGTTEPGSFIVVGRWK